MNEVSAQAAFSKFKPEGCVFVISIDEKGRPSGMTAGWFMKCSFSPPLLAVALQKAGFTQKLIRGSREFVVAVPGKALEKEIVFFGVSHGDKTNKFEETGLEMQKAKFVKPPLVADATFNFECRLEKEVDAGDHIIFIGRVLAAHWNEGKILFNMGKNQDGTRVFEEF